MINPNDFRIGHELIVVFPQGDNPIFYLKNTIDSQKIDLSETTQVFEMKITKSFTVKRTCTLIEKEQ
jgi:hypothetical protein